MLSDEEIKERLQRILDHSEGSSEDILEALQQEARDLGVEVMYDRNTNRLCVSSMKDQLKNIKTDDEIRSISPDRQYEDIRRKHAQEAMRQVATLVKIIEDAERPVKYSYLREEYGKLIAEKLYRGLEDFLKSHPRIITKIHKGKLYYESA